MWMLSEHTWKAHTEIGENANTLCDYVYDSHSHDRCERNWCNSGKEKVIPHLGSKNIRWGCNADNGFLSLLCFVCFTLITFINLRQILFWKLVSQSVNSSVFLHTSPFSSSGPSLCSLKTIKSSF